MHSESFRMESGPDGVRIEVKTDDDGDETQQVYEGESLDELLEAHPELRERIDLGSPGPGFLGPRLLDLDDLLGRLRLRDGFGWPRLSLPHEQVSQRPDRLGVLVREAGSFSTSFDAVPDGVGLLVDRVLPGSLAQHLGVTAGDVLIELDGTALRRTSDVADVLARRALDAELELIRVDAKGEKRTTTWTPPAP